MLKDVVAKSFNMPAPLISTDAFKAQHFDARLAQSYKILLLKKDLEFVMLQEELRFREDYFFLLQLWHKGKLQLETKRHESELRNVLILLFSMQALVENAMLLFVKTTI